VFDDLDEVIKVIQVVHANSSRVVGARMIRRAALFPAGSGAPGWIG